MRTTKRPQHPANLARLSILLVNRRSKFLVVCRLGRSVPSGHRPSLRLTIGASLTLSGATQRFARELAAKAVPPAPLRLTFVGGLVVLRAAPSPLLDI